MIILIILFILVGFIALFYGAKLTVISLENIAERLGVSHILIGLTILAIGTSLPEIAVSIIGGVDKLMGISEDIDGIVIGNKIGSFFTQVTLILGILGMSKAIFVSKWELKREGSMMFISVIIFLLCALDGIITRLESILMIIAYILYLLVVIKSEKKRRRTEEEIKRFIAKRDGLDILEDKKKAFVPFSYKKSITLFTIGLVILLIGAEITILSAIELAKELNIPGLLIGIFIIGLGTSIPELAADLTALKRKDDGIAVGDILGSNICDILLATASGSIIAEFSVPLVILYFDIPMLLIAIALLYYFLWSDNTLKKWEAMFLISFYGFYALLKILFFQI
ncbi:MAG: calcium/sodium antiporter [Promethearchaeota archaeon]